LVISPLLAWIFVAAMSPAAPRITVEPNLARQFGRFLLIGVAVAIVLMAYYH
jgi:hypothetical protein